MIYIFQAPTYVRAMPRALLSPLEAEVRKLGLSGIALHVFGHNTRALDLYQGLGFHPTNISMFKPIELG